MTSKRSALRFHLLTAVIAMIAVGGLLLLNLVPVHRVIPDDHGWVLHGYCRGWPWICHFNKLFYTYPPTDEEVAKQQPFLHQSVWNSWELWGDIGVAFLIVLSVAVSVEILLRRRENPRSKP